MSKLKQSLDSSVLKEKFVNLFEGIDRNNTSRLIVERYLAHLSSLEIAEGKISPTDALSELRGYGVEQNKARHLVTASTINETKTISADRFLIQRVALLESAMKDLKAYDWVKGVSQFIKEGTEFLKRNEVSILLERIMFDLEMDKNSGYYRKAINRLVEARESENPVFFVLENLESEKWIPLVKRLYEYCESIKGSVNGHNPNFTVSRIYSPVEFVEEKGSYIFTAGRRVFETNGEEITEFEGEVSDTFKKLSYVTETAKFSNKGMRLYPNPNSVIDLEFTGGETRVQLNNRLVESEALQSQLIAGGYLKYTETGKIAQIQLAIQEGRNVKELDFGYSVKSNLFEGVSVNVFNLSDKIYVQKINPAMKENSFILAESADDAVRIVKEFINYDISGSLTHLLENEKAEAELRSKEIAKIEGRIKFLIESRENLERVAKLNGVENTTKIKSAIELLESQIAEQNEELVKVSGKSEEISEAKISEKMSFTEIKDKYLNNPYGIGANRIEYIEGKNGNSSTLIFRHDQKLSRDQIEKTLKGLGIPSKKMHRLTKDKAFKDRYELIMYENEINESELNASELANFLRKEEKHFAAFLKPKRMNVSENGNVVTLSPASGSFTITADYNKKEITSTGKPAYPESVSYVEIMEFFKYRTGFKTINESEEISEAKISEKMSFTEIKDKYLNNPYGIGANGIEYIEGKKGNSSMLIFRGEDKYGRDQIEKKLKDLGIPTKKMRKSTADKAFKYRYELTLFENEINESHFKVGDQVKCKASGKTGEVVKLDKDHGEDDEKYYTVKVDGGEEMKYAPNELELMESSVNEAHCEAGKEYTIEGIAYIYQGVTDGVHIFNSKDGYAESALNMSEEEYKKACESGKIQ